MTPHEWLDVARSEYLDGFIRDGGAAVKVLVPADDESRRAILDGLRGLAERSGFQFASVDAATTRMHMIDKLFNAVARQVDWDGLSRAFLLQLLADQRLKLPGDPADIGSPAIAALNDFPEPLFRTEAHRWLWRAIYQDYAMSREFRLAMIRLCVARLDPSDDPGLEGAVKDWLRGDLRLLSAVRRAQIFQRIARHNARHMLDSLAHWLKLAGRSGLVLALDISRYAQTVRPADRDASLHYTTPAALDAYEVVRQFIDATDELAQCFVVVTSGPEFLHDERRGLRSYHALYLRVADDVRDRHRQNPLASLVRIAAAG